MKHRNIFMKNYCLVSALVSAALAIYSFCCHDYWWALIFVVFTFIDHVSYDYYKNKVNQHRNEKDNSENPPQIG